MNNQKGFLMEFLVVLGFVFLTVFFVLLATGVRLSRTGSGKHTGFVTAIEQEGFFFQNYNVYVKTDNSSSQEDVYCLDRSKTELADKIKAFSKERELVSVEYRGVRGIGFGLCRGEEITNVTLDK